MKFVRKLLNKIGLDFYSETQLAKNNADMYNRKSWRLEVENMQQREHIDYLYKKNKEILSPHIKDVNFYKSPDISVYDRIEPSRIRLPLEPIQIGISFVPTRQEFIITDNEVSKNNASIMSDFYCEKIKHQIYDYIDNKIRPFIMKQMRSKNV